MNSQQTDNSQEKQQSLDLTPTPTSRNSDNPNNIFQTGNSGNTNYSQQTEQTEVTQSTVSKRVSGKQRKESLEEYRETFLQVPKLDDRKPVFVSREVRDQLDEIVRKLGGRKMSVSGFIENLARHHLSAYHEDIEVWKRL